MLPHASLRHTYFTYLFMGHIHIQMFPYASKCSHMPQTNSPNYYQMLQNASKCLQFFSNASKCSQMFSNAADCSHMLANAFQILPNASKYLHTQTREHNNDTRARATNKYTSILAQRNTQTHKHIHTRTNPQTHTHHTHTHTQTHIGYPTKPQTQTHKRVLQPQ